MVITGPLSKVIVESDLLKLALLGRKMDFFGVIPLFFSWRFSHVYLLENMFCGLEKEVDCAIFPSGLYVFGHQKC